MSPLDGGIETGSWDKQAPQMDAKNYDWSEAAMTFFVVGGRFRVEFIHTQDGGTSTSSS